VARAGEPGGSRTREKLLFWGGRCKLSKGGLQRLKGTRTKKGTERLIPWDRVQALSRKEERRSKFRGTSPSGFEKTASLKKRKTPNEGPQPEHKCLAGFGDPIGKKTSISIHAWRGVLRSHGGSSKRGGEGILSASLGRGPPRRVDAKEKAVNTERKKGRKGVYHVERRKENRRAFVPSSGKKRGSFQKGSAGHWRRTHCRRREKCLNGDQPQEWKIEGAIEKKNREVGMIKRGGGCGGKKGGG